MISVPVFGFVSVLEFSCKENKNSFVAMGASNTVMIDVGGEKVIKVKRELFSVAGDNMFASMFSEPWNEVDEKGRFFVDYSPQVFVPLIEFLRLVRDSEPGKPCPVVVSPEYRRAWIRMMLVSSFHPEVLRKAGVTVPELKDTGCDTKFIKDAGYTAAEWTGEIICPGNIVGLQNSRELLEAGFSIEDLREAGYTVGQLKRAGLTVLQLLKGGFSSYRDLVDSFSSFEVDQFFPLAGSGISSHRWMWR